MKCGRLQRLRPGQVLYQETDPAQAENAWFLVLYGKLILRTRAEGTLGVAAAGDSVGEEMLLSSEYCVREETCVAEGRAGVLVFEREKFSGLKNWLTSIGLKSDYLLLASVFRKCYDRKKAWRRAQAAE